MPTTLLFSLGPNQPIYFFKGLWNSEDLPLEVRVEEIAADNIREMKMIQPTGPYFLGGYSMGGLIAFEMARQLSLLGEKIALLFLLEPVTPLHLSSNKAAEERSLRSKIGRPYPLKKRGSKFQTPIRDLKIKIFEIGFNVFNAIVNSRSPWLNALRIDYANFLYWLYRKESFAKTHRGKYFIHKVMQTMIDSRLSLPAEFREKYVINLYTNAKSNYISQTYPGQIIIFKTKRSSVKLDIWKQLAEAGVVIKEMDLKTHQDPIKAENGYLWVNGLKDYLEKAHENHLEKTKTAHRLLQRF
jgi:hypothetical protein